MIKEPKGIHDVIKCLFFSKIFGKTSVQPRTQLCLQFSDQRKNGESYTMPLGLRLCLRIEWAHTEIFPKLPEVSHNNTVFTVEYYGT